MGEGRRGDERGGKDRIGVKGRVYSVVILRRNLRDEVILEYGKQEYHNSESEQVPCHQPCRFACRLIAN